MEFLRSFLRRHLAGKPVVESPNVSCFLRLRFLVLGLSFFQISSCFLCLVPSNQQNDFKMDKTRKRVYCTYQFLWSTKFIFVFIHKHQLYNLRALDFFKTFFSFCRLLMYGQSITSCSLSHSCCFKWTIYNKGKLKNDYMLLLGSQWRLGAKTFLKKWINAVSKFIAIIPCRSNCQMLINFFWNWILKYYI